MKRIVTAIFAAVLALSVPVAAQDTGSTTADVTFVEGQLLLNQITSFNFGSHAISPTEKSHPASAERIFVNVQDLRGSGAGWKVTAAGSTFQFGGHVLEGAKITFTDGEAHSPVGSAAKPIVEESILLDMDSGQSTLVAKALSGQGLGNWSIEWNGEENDNQSVVLDIPGGVGRVGTYSATITWTLTNAP